ncbi:DUF5802 family protein [Salinirubellus sp. GCM10025818]|uniref:DUF5802 family protein n=1 Tax=Salinirubellus TaxID=2162630 RepID=UPI0030D24D17
MAQFEELSASYYVGQLYIEPTDGEHAVMEREQHEAANEQIYTTGERVERVDHPLIVKLDETHFLIFGAEDVPKEMLGLPDAVLEATQVDTPPTLRSVLVAKAARAAQLLDWYTPYTVTESAVA